MFGNMAKLKEIQQKFEEVKKNYFQNSYNF